ILTGGNVDKSGAIDMGPSGIVLVSNHPLQVTLSYDGTTLTETVQDTVTRASFTHAYTVDLATAIGSGTAYVGFTGSTGGETAIQQIRTWSFPSIDFSRGFGSHGNITTNGSVTFPNGITLPPAISSLIPTGLAVGDVNNDGNLDVALFEGDQIEVLYG